MTRRILLAATASGAGKTTVSIGLIRALTRRGLSVASAKIGPDYIDPQYHKAAGGTGMNLDAVLTEPAYRRYLLRKMEREDIVVMEGAMGFYDGMGTGSRASAAEMASETKTPVILIATGAGRGLSLAAEIKGFLDFAPHTVAGILLNRTKPALYTYYKEIVETHTGLPLLGCIPALDREIPARHLGLVGAEEWSAFESYTEAAADALATHADLDRILAVAESPPTESEYAPARMLRPVRCALARDEAFCFYYNDVLEEAEAARVEWVPFSPLRDPLPAGISGLYMGGGYPELYREALGARRDLAADIRDFRKRGGVLVAEGGGFLALQEAIDDAPFWGVVPGRVSMTDRLQNFGYFIMAAEKEGLLLQKGEEMGVHEFHYGRSSAPGDDFRLTKPTGKRGHTGGLSDKNSYMGFPHVHLMGNDRVRSRWLKALEAAPIWVR